MTTLDSDVLDALRLPIDTPLEDKDMNNQSDNNSIEEVDVSIGVLNKVRVRKLPCHDHI